MLLYLLAVVIEEPAAVSASANSTPPHVYLHPTTGCDSRASSDEIVVCAKKGDEQYRVHSVDETGYQAKPIRAEMKIGRATLSLHGANGADGKTAMMLTFKLPF